MPILDCYGTPLTYEVTMRRGIGFVTDEWVEDAATDTILGIQQAQLRHVLDWSLDHRGRSAGMPPQRKHPLPGRE